MDFLSNSIIISCLILSLILIVITFVFISLPLYRVYGITILVFYTILTTISISYFSSVKFGPVIPIALFIIILFICLLLLINTNLRSCTNPSKDTPTEKSCLEQFSTPVGITKLNNGKWCVKDSDGNCLSSDGTSSKIDDPHLKNLQQNLSTSQTQCDQQINDLKNSISLITKNDQQSISAGPCLTVDGKWGVIIPKYGNKCVSTNSSNKSKLNGETNVKPDDKKVIDYSKLSGKEMKDMYNNLYKKQGIIRPSIADNKKVLESDECYPKETNFNEICENNFGSFYTAQTPDKCPCPFTNDVDGNCDKIQRFNARCECKLPTDKKYTDCKPITSDFNYWCKVKYGNNYGYREILKGPKGCCGKNDNMAIAECTTNAQDGFNIYDMATTCLPSNNYYELLDACRQQYPKDDIIAVKNIGGYNCDPGYFKSQCVKKLDS